MFAACLLGAAPAHATEFCVDTAAQLAGALLLAPFTQPDGELTIRVRTGTYNLAAYGDSIDLQSAANDVRLLGGYGSGCTTRAVDPANTVLDFGGERFGLSSYGRGITFEGLHLRNFSHSQLTETPDCTPRGEALVFRRNIVESQFDWPLMFSPVCSDLRIDNNLVLGGQGLDIFASAQVDGLQAVIANNTVRDSLDEGLRLGVYDSEAILFQVYNNVFWGNAGPGLAISAGTTATAFNNTWDDIAGAPLVQADNSAANPLLLANHRLAAGSPAVNSGNNAVPGGLPANDNDGGARRIGSTVDRGAFESAVDDAFTQVVTNASDSGAGSLRQAILNANADPGFNRIEFDVPLGSGQCLLLQPATPYPGITESVLIDGTSQPGSAVNTLEQGDNATLCVRIVDLATPRLSHALDVPTSAGAGVTLTLQGVAFGGFEQAVQLRGGGGHMVFGNHFGVGVASLFPPNTTGLASTAPQVRIGGVDPSTRNVFAGNGTGLVVSGDGSRVTNNYIGTSRNGQEGSPSSGYANDVGLRLADGEDVLASNNVISGNAIGVEIPTPAQLLAQPPRLSGNRIGLRAKTFCLPQPGAPCSTVPNRIGIWFHGPGSVVSNSIAYNQEDGVWIDGVGMQGARLSANRIFGNGALGIDIDGDDAPDGPNPEGYDGPGAYSTPNWGQNAPVVEAAAGSAGSGTVQGVLRSTNGTFRVEVFSSASCDASESGEGEVYHGETMVTITDADDANFESGEATFSSAIERGDTVVSLVGRAITATATRADGSTSEFSNCTVYVDDGSGAVLFSDGFED